MSVLRWDIGLHNEYSRGLPCLTKISGGFGSRIALELEGKSHVTGEIPSFTLRIAVLHIVDGMFSLSGSWFFYGLRPRRTVIEEYEPSLRASSNVIWNSYFTLRKLGRYLDPEALSLSRSHQQLFICRPFYRGDGSPTRRRRRISELYQMPPSATLIFTQQGKFF